MGQNRGGVGRQSVASSTMGPSTKYLTTEIIYAVFSVSPKAIKIE